MAICLRFIWFLLMRFLSSVRLVLQGVNPLPGTFGGPYNLRVHLVGRFRRVRLSCEVFCQGCD